MYISGAFYIETEKEDAVKTWGDYGDPGGWRETLHSIQTMAIVAN